MVLRPRFPAKTRLRHFAGRRMLRLGLEMGIQIIGARERVRTRICRYQRLDGKSSSRVLGTHPGTSNAAESR